MKGDENGSVKDTTIPYSEIRTVAVEKTSLNACKQAFSPANNSQGWASWYGKRFHGRRTASGEKFNMYAMTAAHRSFPFGSKVRVRNLCTGETVIVRINDRGPRSKKRVIDVSYAAARAIGAKGAGIIPVELYLLPES